MELDFGGLGGEQTCVLYLPRRSLTYTKHRLGTHTFSSSSSTSDRRLLSVFSELFIWIFLRVYWFSLSDNLVCVWGEGLKYFIHIYF